MFVTLPTYWGRGGSINGTHPLYQVYSIIATNDKTDLDKFSEEILPEALPFLAGALIMPFKEHECDPPPSDFPVVCDYYHDKVIQFLRTYARDKLQYSYSFDDWRNKFIKNICDAKYSVQTSDDGWTGNSGDDIELLDYVNFDNAYLEYSYTVGQNKEHPTGYGISIAVEQLVFCSGDIEEAKWGSNAAGFIVEGETEYYVRGYHNSKRRELVPVYFNLIQTPDKPSETDEVGIVVDDKYGSVYPIGDESATSGDFVTYRYNTYHAILKNAKDYNNIKYQFQLGGWDDLAQRQPIWRLLNRVRLLGRDANRKGPFNNTSLQVHYGFIRLKDLSFEDLTAKTSSEYVWGWNNFESHYLNTNILSLQEVVIEKGPICRIDTSAWRFLPVLKSNINIKLWGDKYITENDEVLYDLIFENKTINYKDENLEIKNGIARNISQKFFPLYDNGRYNYSLKTIDLPIVWVFDDFESQYKFTLLLKKVPHHFTGSISNNTSYLEWGFSYGPDPTIDVDYNKELQSAQFNFKLEFTGMGNDPCKECCCDCEIEPKKYKTVVEFTSDEVLADRAIITPETLEYEWQDNTLILMLEKDQEVTVDNLPVGTKYEISLDMDGEEYDECDKNEYSIENSSGTVGENSEGEEEEETEIVVNAQAGETIQQYLDRLRQRGYEQLAENLKLENVEFTLQDERIKLGDLVTVDLPEFDFKAVVRVTGVKLKSQGNQTIRTISVGTPLKILRRSKI